MSKAFNHLKSNAVAYVALFVALGGTSYAATTLGAGSVGTRQLKNHSISPIKFQRGSIAGYVRDWAKIDTAGQISASRPRAHLVGWTDQPGGAFPGGLISWGEFDPVGVLRNRDYWQPGSTADVRERRDHQRSEATAGSVAE